MINFVVREEKKVTETDRVKRTLSVMTTLVLVVYLVGIAGVLGWKWYWTGREKTVTEEHARLLKQLATKSETEILARKLDSRTKAAQQFWESRGRAADTASSLLYENTQVTGWKYNVAGIQTARVASNNRQTILDLVEKLKGQYKNVGYDGITWNSRDGWVATIKTEGGINATTN